MPAKIPPVAPLADVEPWSRRAPAVRVALLLATHQPPALPALPDVRAAQDDLSVELLEGEGVVHASLSRIERACSRSASPNASASSGDIFTRMASAWSAMLRTTFLSAGRAPVDIPNLLLLRLHEPSSLGVAWKVEGSLMGSFLPSSTCSRRTRP